MPYVQTDSPSPPRPEFAPIHQDVPSGSGVKKPKTTMAEIQRRQLEKLLENPEKEVQLPVGFQEKTLRAPREMMKNVQGSSAGAGSGEFHVYKQSRRREYDRIKIMNDNSRALEEQAEFQKRQAERDAAADAKTAKNRQKRLKRKGGGKKGTEGGGGGGEAVVKRKLENGAAGVIFKRPGAEEEENEDEDEDEAGPMPAVEETTQKEEEEVAPVRIADEAKIVIVDED